MTSTDGGGPLSSAPITYSLAEIRDGTGWPEGARFVLVVSESWLADLADALREASDFIVSVKGDKYRAPFSLIEKINDALRIAGRLEP